MLPREPTKYWCRAFYLAAAGALLVGVLVCLLLMAEVAAIVLLGLAIGAAGLGVRADAGVVAPALYRAVAFALLQLRRVVRATAQIACFAIVAAARVGSHAVAVARPPQRTMWSPKASLPRDAYEATYVRAGGEPARGWPRRYLAWARSTGNAWAMALLPFLAMHRSAQDPDDFEVRGEIYTLY